VRVTCGETARLERRELVASGYHERARGNRRRWSTGDEVSLQRGEAEDRQAEGSPDHEVSQQKGSNIGDRGWLGHPLAQGFLLKRGDGSH
jgi:hypothetical protein